MNGNPYRPPAAAVADARRPNHRPRPLPVKVAAMLLVIGLTFAVIGVSEQWGMMANGEMNPVHFLGKLLVYAAPAFFIFPIVRGRNWARLATAICAALALLTFLLDPASMRSALTGGIFYAYDPVTAAIQSVPHLVNAVAMVLLFWPARAWFSRVD